MIPEAAILALHSAMPKQGGDVVGPYCYECTSPIDGGPELWPCLTVKVVEDSRKGRMVG